MVRCGRTWRGSRDAWVAEGLPSRSVGEVVGVVVALAELFGGEV